MIELDLTQDGVLPPAILRRLDAIADAEIAPFNDFVAQLSRGRERDIDWWVSRPACRNNFVSSLFHRCVQLRLIQNLLAEGQLVRVRIDDLAFAKTLASIPGGVTVDCRKPSWLRPWVTAWHGITSSLFHAAASNIAAAMTGKLRQTERGDRLIAIDVFVLRDSVRSGRFHDRYFPGLIAALLEEERTRIRYVPQFYRIRDYLGLFRELRKSDILFLLPQDWLKLSDYIFAFGHWFRLKKFRNLAGHYNGIEIGALVRSDLDAGRFTQSAINALLTYRLWRRLDHAAPGFTHVIDWYEGQDIDHALSAALNWHGSAIRAIGFRPACSKLEMSVMPAAHEVECGVVASTMAVVGEGYRREIAQNLPMLKTLTAPGLRYARLSSLKREARGEKTCILIILPLAVSSLKPLRDLIGNLPENPAQLWLLKPHPALPPGVVESIFGNQSCLTMVTGDYYDWLPRADIVIGLESSALLEAVALGVPAICLARGNIPTKSPFPDWLDRKWWQVCYNQSDFQSALARFATIQSTEAELAQMRRQLLSPANDAAIDAFMVEIGATPPRP
jgi:hypothetical protein